MKSTLSKCLSGAFAAAALAFVAGCNQNPPPPETTGNYVDDAAVTTKVKAALMGDNVVKSMQISVSTTQGTVTLTGVVDTSDQKSAAAKDASSVAGVKDVTNNLTVR